MIKRILILVLSIILSIGASACSVSQGKSKESMEIIVAPPISFNLGNTVEREFELNDTKIQGVEMIKAFPQDQQASVGHSDKKVTLKYKTATPLPQSLITVYGQDLYVHASVLKIKIDARDYNKFLKDAAEKNIYILGRKESSNKPGMYFSIVSPFDGKSMGFNMDIENPEPMEGDKLETLFNGITKDMINVELIKRRAEYLNKNPEITKKAEELTKNKGSAHEKALAIGKFVKDYVTNPCSDDVSNRTIENAWKNKTGVCVNEALLTKLMLETINIESYLWSGFAKNKQNKPPEGHVFLVYHNEQDQWKELADQNFFEPRKPVDPKTFADFYNKDILGIK